MPRYKVLIREVTTYIGDDSIRFDPCDVSTTIEAKSISKACKIAQGVEKKWVDYDCDPPIQYVRTIMSVTLVENQ